MLKAMLIVTALGGGADYTTEMPSMNECLDARVAISEQNSDVKTLCVPMIDETVKVQEFFDIFMDMIDQIREYESYSPDYVCDSSVRPGIVIQTIPPKINCDEEYNPSSWPKEAPSSDKKW